MNLKTFIRVFLLVWFAFASFAEAQTAQCISRIQKRLDVVGTADFDFYQARQIIKEFEFGKTREFVNDPTGNKKEAFQRIFTSMSEFLELAPNDLSGKALAGYTKFSGCMIKSGDIDLTELNLEHLKQCFLTKTNDFKGTNCNAILESLGDEAKFDFDAASQTFTSKSSGLKFSPMDYPGFGDEQHTINHILRQHLDNAVSRNLGKSKFKDEIVPRYFDLIDKAFLNKGSATWSDPNWIYDVYMPDEAPFSGQKQTLRLVVANDGGQPSNQVVSVVPISNPTN